MATIIKSNCSPVTEKPKAQDGIVLFYCIFELFLHQKIWEMCNLLYVLVFEFIIYNCLNANNIRYNFFALNMLSCQELPDTEFILDKKRGSILHSFKCFLGFF